jgi:hypothetical protein
MRTLTIMIVLGCLAGAARAAEPATVDRIEVKTRDTDDRDHASLRFLRDNRDFLRAQLDRLRLEVHRDRNGAARELDPRHLALREMAAAIAAARDTVAGSGADLDRRTLLASVAGLADLEMQLGLMDSLLDDQRQRLTWLEADFLGRQETALVVLVRGHAGGRTPAGLILREAGETLRVDLSDEQRASLARGGIVQIDHRLVEPRDHALTVALDGDPWDGSELAVLEVPAARDRLTFLELDLAALDPRQPAGRPAARVWQR